MGRRIILLGLSVLLLAAGCGDEPGVGMEVPVEGTISGPSTPTPYALEVPAYLPAPIVDPENPVSVEGVELGRHIFYDAEILSTDGTMSCASCHRQELAFTDGLDRSLGVRRLAGSRSAMSLVNLAFNPNGFNWDGSAPKLWEQAIHPVEDMLELDNDWEEVLRKLRADADYPARFRAAFGIDNTAEISRELTIKALAQFERTIISADSKYDRVVYHNTDFFTEQEQLGADSLFFVENLPPGALHPGCGHCHNAPSFGDNKFHNNGLDDVASLDDFIDKGLGGVNGNRFDNGKFRTPTLRNIALTAPYMHDGRFETLEEVLDHYASGGHDVENEDPNITGFTLTEREKEALLAFLHTLTDESLLTDARFAAPH
ncbi:Cytochrome c551 peroxidase [Neolewinella maritima]|uniref:Cytochrome c551 peroxidase n=1 Tax=Neolewinella maritima TaxID=1383882 RepID=A0ABM9B0E8_9BACT|nr:cytochrome c peroxidase [Neolewinella maritima]CAH1000569.1 Cytochrome c551 peroxidase [Neolewinella maritima]